MERIEEIKNLIVQLEIKLKELKNEIFPDEILVTIEEFKEVELVTSTYQIDYLKFRNFRFESQKDSISSQNINKDIVLDIKNGEEPGSDYYVDYLNKNQNDLPFIRTSDLINHQIDLFPDNFIPYDIANDFMIDLKEGDVLFTKDGKIGSTGMVVKNDLNLAVLSAGISRIRLKKNSIITPEFLFLALTIKEIGFYPVWIRV